jgi:hypothetical protein
MSYIYGAPSKARNLTSYIYGRDYLLGVLLLEPCITLMHALIDCSSIEHLSEGTRNAP